MCYSWEIVVPKAKNCQKSNGQKVVKKLQKVVKKLSKSCQKVVKKLQKSCQKVVKKFKIQQTVVGGWGGGGEIVVPRPSASASLTGRRHKQSKIKSLSNNAE
jgi:uncharacterized protein (UPF0303 family)